MLVISYTYTKNQIWAENSELYNIICLNNNKTKGTINITKNVILKFTSDPALDILDISILQYAITQVLRKKYQVHKCSHTFIYNMPIPIGGMISIDTLNHGSISNSVYRY